VFEIKNFENFELKFKNLTNLINGSKTIKRVLQSILIIFTKNASMSIQDYLQPSN